MKIIGEDVANSANLWAAVSDIVFSPRDSDVVDVSVDVPRGEDAAKYVRPVASGRPWWDSPSLPYT